MNSARQREEAERYRISFEEAEHQHRNALARQLAAQAELMRTNRADLLPLLQKACYEMLAPPERRALHAKTAEAFNDLAGGQDAVPPELLAYHYECAEQWVPGAEANLRAGDRAAELFLNQEAVRCYQRAVEMLNLVETPAEEGLRLVVLAHTKAARARLRIGAYASAEEDVRKVQGITVCPCIQAEADRLAGLVYLQTGRTAEAERFLLNVVALAPDDAVDGVRAEALCDLARLHYKEGRKATARGHLCECRTIAKTGGSLALIQADLLDRGTHGR